MNKRETEKRIKMLEVSSEADRYLDRERASENTNLRCKVDQVVAEVASLRNRIYGTHSASGESGLVNQVHDGFTSIRMTIDDLRDELVATGVLEPIVKATEFSATGEERETGDGVLLDGDDE